MRRRPRQRERQKSNRLISKTRTLHVQHTFRTFFVVAARLGRDIPSCDVLNLSLQNVAKGKIRQKIPNFILWNFEKQVAPCVSTGREVSFKWSLHWVSSTASKVRATLQNPIIHSGSERVKEDVNTPRQISLSPSKLGCRLTAVPENSNPGEVTYIWDFTRVGIIVTEF